MVLAGLLFLAPSAPALRETPGQLLQAALNRSIADRSSVFHVAAGVYR